MILDLINPESSIAYFKEYVDIYLYKNQIWIGRSWPRKIKPPYSDVQAEYQTVFGVAKRIHSLFSLEVLNSWKNFKSKSLPNWYDQIVGIFLNWYFVEKTFVPVVTDYRLEVNGSFKRIVFVIYYNYDKNLVGGTTVEKVSDWFDISYLNSFEKGLYITLFDENEMRVCAPWVHLIG